MKDTMTRNKLTAEERLNWISEHYIWFDKHKKQNGVLSGAMPAQAALEAPPSLPPAKVPKILA